MKRVFWLTVGVTVGALVVRKLSRQAAKLTPEGLAQQAKHQATGLGDAIREFAEDVREGIAARENELHQALLPGQDGSRAESNGHSNGHRGIDPDAAARFARDSESPRNY